MELTDDQLHHLMELIDVLERRQRLEGEPYMKDHWHTFKNLCMRRESHATHAETRHAQGS